MQTIVLRNGTLYDGTGAAPVAGDLLIRGSRIAEGEVPSSGRVIDCTGLAVAPGFIDAHSHSDLQVLEDRPEKVLQGVTTEVVGNCGFSAYPAGADPKPLHEFANGIFCGGDDWGWPSAREYLSAAAASPTVNVSSLVGHGSLRIQVAGNRLGPLDKRDVETMESILNEALTDGACGLSTGLMYAPGSSAPIEELERLCCIVARHDGIYTTHIRSYFSGLVDAVDEQIGLARRTGCRLQISHLQAVGAKNWPLQARALESIENACREGIDIVFDCYPYVAGSTVLTQALPQWVLEGGLEGMLARLTDRAERARIAAETETALEWRWSDIYISAVASERNRAMVGRNMAELSELRHRAPVDVMIDLLIEEKGAVNMLCFNQSEDNLRQTLSHPLSIIISDGFYVRGRPHPRLHGTFPLLLGRFCREISWLGLSQAIHKITDKPARRFGIRERGRLAHGYLADVTVFDPAAIGSPATYDSPELPPEGIRYVFRNGHVQYAHANGSRSITG
jgi:dihydroorotase/N-acyl-D-amino-acid deacylase